MASDSPFIVVCGLPRSGTRQFTDILNKDPRVCIQAEIRPIIIPRIHALIKEADSAYSAHRAEHSYQQKRPQAIAELFAYFSKGRVLQKQSARLFGFKTPSVERRHKLLSEIVLPSYKSIVFLFCVRNFIHCYLSLSSMPWFKKTEEEYTDMYLGSLNAAIEIIGEKKPDVQIQCLNLDDFLAAPQKGPWISSRIFRSISLDVSEDASSDYYSRTRNINATQNVTGSSKRDFLDDREKEYFRTRKNEINDCITNFNRSLKVTLDELSL